MSIFILLLFAAAIGSALSHLFKLPSIPFMMLTGAVLSAAVSQFFSMEKQDVLGDTIVLGATFLVFSAGLRLNPRMMGERRMVTLKVAAAQFLSLGLLGYLASVVLGYQLQTALYLGVALAASSTLVSVSLLSQRKQLFTPFGRLTTGVLLVQDLLVILLISIIPQVSLGVTAVFIALLKILAMIALAAAVVYNLSTPLLTRWAKNDEMRLLAGLGILFLFTGLANLLGLPVIAGAFLAGLSLSAFPAELLVQSQLNSLEVFFGAAFFTALGANLAYVPLNLIPHGLIYVLILLVATPLVVTWVGVKSGLHSRSSLESGLMLSQTSEFSLLAALAGMNAGVLDPDIFALVALVTLLTMLVTPFLSTDDMTWKILRLFPSRSGSASELDLMGHILLIGGGKTGRQLLEDLRQEGHSTAIIDTDPAVVQELKDEETTVIQGDGADLETLKKACANQARAVLSTLPRFEDNERLLKELKCPFVVVRHDDPATAHRIEALGGIPVTYVDMAAEEVLQWLKEKRSVKD